jgi:RNA-directed DNA polymerase
LIEAPREPLRYILSQLNDHLQAVYHQVRSPAAYGFIINRKRDPDVRNIVTNAKAHTGNKWLINMDMKDFFHHVRRERLLGIFRSPPFRFNESAAEIVTGLTTFKDRLPMGSPTSPVLSNFATLHLDQELIQWAKRNRTRYTRFVDDCTFSASHPLNEVHVLELKDVFRSHGFEINPAKTKVYGESDVKTVTGLELRDRPEIPSEFFNRLGQDLDRLKHTVEVHMLNGGAGIPEWVRDFETSLKGKINFIGMVYGIRSDKYRQFHRRLEAATAIDEELLFAGWRDFDNYAF